MAPNFRNPNVRAQLMTDFKTDCGLRIQDLPKKNGRNSRIKSHTKAKISHICTIEAKARDIADRAQWEAKLTTVEGNYADCLDSGVTSDAYVTGVDEARLNAARQNDRTDPPYSDASALMLSLKRRQ